MSERNEIPYAFLDTPYNRDRMVLSPDKKMVFISILLGGNIYLDHPLSPDHMVIIRNSGCNGDKLLIMFGTCDVESITKYDCHQQDCCTGQCGGSSIYYQPVARRLCTIRAWKVAAGVMVKISDPASCVLVEDKDNIFKNKDAYMAMWIGLPFGAPTSLTVIGSEPVTDDSSRDAVGVLLSEQREQEIMGVLTRQMMGAEVEERQPYKFLAAGFYAADLVSRHVVAFSDRNCKATVKKLGAVVFVDRYITTEYELVFTLNTGSFIAGAFLTFTTCDPVDVLLKMTHASGCREETGCTFIKHEVELDGVNDVLKVGIIRWKNKGFYVRTESACKNTNRPVPDEDDIFVGQKVYVGITAVLINGEDAVIHIWKDWIHEGDDEVEIEETNEEASRTIWTRNASRGHHDQGCCIIL